MKIDKALRIIWLIIGLLLLVILPYAIYQMAIKSFDSDYDNGFDQSLVVGDEQIESVREGKMIQGVFYDNINKIEGTPYYIVPLSAKKFKTSKDIDKFVKEYEYDKTRAGDSGYDMYFGNVSFIFLDSNYNVINSMPKSKAYIKNYRTAYNDYERYNKIDPTVKSILYEIGFNDSNKDGLLNDQDDLDLYISDITGNNLKRLTNNFDIQDYRFVKENTEVFITYYESKISADEYKRKLFARYIVAENRLVELSSLQREILEVEKRLMLDTLVTP